jgi:hypothetical protein
MIGNKLLERGSASYSVKRLVVVPFSQLQFRNPERENPS